MRLFIASQKFVFGGMEHNQAVTFSWPWQNAWKHGIFSTRKNYILLTHFHRNNEKIDMKMDV
jgi:hypothetical protein